MKKEVVGGNVVQSNPFKYGFKAGSRTIDAGTHAAITTAMKDMLGNKQAVAVRVAAV